MSKGVKIFLWVLFGLVILAGLAIGAYFWAKNAWDKISFSAPKLKGVDFRSISLTDLANIVLAGGTKTIVATISMDIKNDNSFKIPFTVKAKLFYQEVLIAVTHSLSGVIPAKGTLTISDQVNIILNQAGAAILIEKIKGGTPKIDYSLSLSLFGIPIPKKIKSSFPW